jgi:hypothetical protein
MSFAARLKIRCFFEKKIDGVKGEWYNKKGF